MDGTDAQLEDHPRSPRKLGERGDPGDSGGEDTPVSATILQRCIQDRSTDLPELADLLNLAPHSVYPYLNDRPLRWEQFRAIFRRCTDPRVRRAFLGDLLPGLGIIATEVDAPMDVDGDGDVDTDDALQSALDAAASASASARSVFDSAASRAPLIAPADLAGLNDLLGEVITQAVMARRILNYLAEQRPRPRQARARVRPLPGAGAPAYAASHNGHGKTGGRR